MATFNLVIPELTHNEYNGEATYNEGLAIIDFHAQSIITAHTTSAEPGSPSEGAAYILPSGCTGTVWAGNDGKIAHYINGNWNLYTPKEGWFVKSKEDNNIYVYDGADWGLFNDLAMLTHDITADSDYTLSTSTMPQEWQYDVVKITDTGTNLTVGRNIIVPTNIKQYIFINGTAQTLTLKTSAGSGIGVATNKNAILLCDGTNVIRLSQDS